MSDKLKEICNVKSQHVEASKAQCPLKEMDAFAQESLELYPVRPFQKALQNKADQKETALICEIKKASPSAGLIRPDFAPSALAAAYQAGGASCLSILTDEPYFQGKNEYLIEARGACTLPVLRKDFMIDPWQIAESRALGADCILLIMAALSDAQAEELHAAATHYQMDVLIESHNAEEVERALKLPTGMIGINNRNLKTLQIDLQTTDELQTLVPDDRLIICESGLKTRDDLAKMQSHEIYSFLIGETLMKQEDVTAATKAIMPLTL